MCYASIGENIMRHLIALIVALAFVTPAWADFDAGIAAYRRGDMAAALREIRPLAEQGHVKAQIWLGVIHVRGDGVPQDSDEALKWFRLAADQGEAAAQHFLAVMYDKGISVPQDHGQAVKWFRKAADQGHAGAQFSLGAMYEKGEGVSKDHAEAMSWYRRAAVSGGSRVRLYGALFERSVAVG